MWFFTQRKINCLSFVFTFFCTCFFIYKAYECVDKYLQSEMVTKTSEENQENYPIPQICINQHWIPDEKLDSLNITYKEYNKQGRLKSNGSIMNEEHIYDYLSSYFTDLVDRVVLSRMANPTSDDYEKVTFKSNEKSRMTLNRCDYYDKLKCFFIKFLSKLIAFGLQAIERKSLLDT